MEVETTQTVYITRPDGEHHFDYRQFVEQFGRELWLCAWMVGMHYVETTFAPGWLLDQRSFVDFMLDLRRAAAEDK